MRKDVKKAFIRIFAVSLAVTLLLSPAPSFHSSPKQSLVYEVQAEDVPITDTQRGIALLMTILLAQGLRFVGDWDTVVQPGLSKLWDDFSTATGNAVTLPMIVAGSSLALGYIRTSNTVNNAIANFTAWYKNTFSQPITGDVSVPVQEGTRNYFTIESCTYYGRQSGNNLARSLAVDRPVRAVVLNAGTYHATAYFVCDTQFQYKPVSSCPFSGSYETSLHHNGYYIWFTEIRNTNMSSNIPYLSDVAGNYSNAILYTYGAN